MMKRILILLAGLMFLFSAVPTPAMEGHGSTTSEESTTTNAPEDEGPSFIYRLTKFSGKFHLLAIHFPIALLLVAAMVQWYYFFSGKGETTVAITLWIGAIGAVFAALLGWAYAYDSVYFGDSEQLLFWHRWLGTSTAVVAILVALLRKKLGKLGLTIAITVAAALVGVAAHYGGSLVYGADFFTDF
jgi:uncharacterized membrane protein